MAIFPILRNFKEYGFAWVYTRKVWFTTVGHTESDAFKEDFLNIFDFTLPSFQALFKRWINNKLKVILVTFTSYSIKLYYTQFNETLWDHGESNA